MAFLSFTSPLLIHFAALFTFIIFVLVGITNVVTCILFLTVGMFQVSHRLAARNFDDRVFCFVEASVCLCLLHSIAPTRKQSEKGEDGLETVGRALERVRQEVLRV